MMTPDGAARRSGSAFRVMFDVASAPGPRCKGSLAIKSEPPPRSVPDPRATQFCGVGIHEVTRDSKLPRERRGIYQSRAHRFAQEIGDSFSDALDLLVGQSGCWADCG